MSFQALDSHRSIDRRGRAAEAAMSCWSSSAANTYESTHEYALEQRPLFGYLFTCLTAGARPGSVEVSGGTLSIRLSTVVRVRLTHGMRSAGHRGAERLKRGLPSSK
jgi:hypothetical protein